MLRPPRNPRAVKGRKNKMVDDCIVLLEWACRNGDRMVSLSIIEEETGIPDDTVRVILNEAMRYRGDSLLAGVASCYNFDYYIFPDWNKEKRYERKKRIIDARHLIELPTRR